MSHDAAGYCRVRMAPCPGLGSPSPRGVFGRIIVQGQTTGNWPICLHVLIPDGACLYKERTLPSIIVCLPKQMLTTRAHVSRTPSHQSMRHEKFHNSGLL